MGGGRDEPNLKLRGKYKCNPETETETPLQTAEFQGVNEAQEIEARAVRFGCQIMQSKRKAFIEYNPGCHGKASGVSASQTGGQEGSWGPTTDC